MNWIPLVFYYHRLNRYSFNALAGALDQSPQFAGYPIYLAKTEEQLHSAIDSLTGSHPKIVVAYSILTPQLPELRLLVSKQHKQSKKRILFIAGGPHACADPAAVLEAGIDIVFHGESEISFPQVIERLNSGEDFSTIPGIAWRKEQDVRINPRANPVDINIFPSFSAPRAMYGPIEITRGCPYTCSYCQTSHIFGVRPRHRSIENIAAQAASLPERKRKIVRLLSPNAFSYGSPDGKQLNLPVIEALLATVRTTIGKSGRIIFGYFPSEVRPEHVTPETLDLLRRYADNDEIVIGAQTGSKRMLAACRRQHDPASVIHAVSLARRSGYRVIVDFIFGLPGESAADIQETVAVIKEICALGARIHPHAFVPLPQTAFSGEKPGRIPAEVVRLLDNLQRQKAIYGDWVAQRRLAHQVWKSTRTNTD
jgi:B12-binding domain/radical SAM domain protein